MKSIKLATGFTLIDLSVAVFTLAFITVSATPKFISIEREQRIEALQSLAGDIQFTINRNNNQYSPYIIKKLSATTASNNNPWLTCTGFSCDGENIREQRIGFNIDTVKACYVSVVPIEELLVTDNYQITIVDNGC